MKQRMRLQELDLVRKTVDQHGPKPGTLGYCEFKNTDRKIYPFVFLKRTGFPIENSKYNLDI